MRKRNYRSFVCVALLAAVSIISSCQWLPEVGSVRLSESSVTLKVGGTKQLSAIVEPAAAEYDEITWTSSDPSVVSVANGQLSARKLGTATITASTEGVTSSPCTVTVEATKVTAVTLNSYSLELTEGEHASLIATVAPSNATNKDVVWTSSNTSVATVSPNGVVIAKNTGSAVVSCTSSSGVHDNCYVFVYAAANIQSPLTFEIITDGIIYLDASEGIAIGMGIVDNPPSLMVEYQKNNNPWEKLYVDDTHHFSDKISVTKGDIVRFRGNNKSYSSMTIDDNNNYSIRAMKFRSSSQVSISGNIMSLIDKDNYKYLSQIVENGAFAMLFKNLEVISAERLYLPTKLSKYCYYDMFDGCKTLVSPPMLASDKLERSCYSGMFANCISLIEAPVLPAKSLVRDCYRGMFYGCSALNRIEANFDTKPSSAYTYYWVYDVSPAGQFYKSYYSNWDVRGIHGIPEGWEIVEQ